MRKLAWTMPWMTVATLLMSGCFTRQRYSYALPPKADIEALHANILQCANEQDISARELFSRLWINVDADTLLIYNLRAPEHRRMTIRLEDGASMTDEEEQREFAAAKRVGDGLMQCAQAKESTP